MAETSRTDSQSNALPAGLEDNLGWLLAQCFRAHMIAAETAVADLPHGARGYLALCGAATCSARNQAELAKQLGVDRTVMVYLVDDLEKAGLVERLPDPADRRSRLIRATVAGVERLNAAQHAISAAESALLATLGQDEQRQLREMLHRIAASQVLGPAAPCPNAGPGADPCSS